ncbi:MAG TPA: DnaA/Hda family protein [Bacteroidia bacterium]|nr:DnaA/Hda family protein [Bacteroidia bacterium]
MKGLTTEIFNPRKQYQFDQFYGNDDQVTRLRLLLVNPYKPLIVISGPGGCGVTHLLNSAGNFFEERNKIAKYITAEWFCEIIRKMDSKSIQNEFLNSLIDCDLLCIDNIQYFYRRKKEYQNFLLDIVVRMNSQGKKIILGCSKEQKDITRSKKIKWPDNFVRIELQTLAGFTVFRLLKRLCTPEDGIPDSLLFLISGFNGSIEQYINCLISIRFRTRLQNLAIDKADPKQLEELLNLKSYFPEQQLRRSFIQNSLPFIESYKKLMENSTS